MNSDFLMINNPRVESLVSILSDLRVDVIRL